MDRPKGHERSTEARVDQPKGHRRPLLTNTPPLAGPTLLPGWSHPHQRAAAHSTTLNGGGQLCPLRSEHLFYHAPVEAPESRLTDVEYLEVQCKSALNPVKGMFFNWSLNPYTGCEHRCAFCYVRAFELRADRPSDDRYGRTVRIKLIVAGVLRSELSRRSWRRETVVIGAATDPYQPAEGRYRLTVSVLKLYVTFRIRARSSRAAR